MTNVKNMLDLTYIVTELPKPPSSAGSGSGSTNNGGQGSSQHSGSNNSAPPTLAGNEPSIEVTNFYNFSTTTIYSDGNGGSVTSTADADVFIIENWSGKNVATKIDTWTAPDNYIRGTVEINRKEIRVDRRGNTTEVVATIPPDPHFYIENLPTFNFHVRGDVQFVEYTTYQSNVATGDFAPQ